MNCHKYLYLVLILSVVFLFSCTPTENETTKVISSGDYEDLVTLFKEFREFHKPKMTNGIPDYSAAAMEEKKLGLKNYQDKEKKAKNVSQEKMEEEIMMQKEKVTLLQQKINEQEQTLSVKEQRIIDLSNQVKNSGTNTPVPTIEEDPNDKEIKSHVALRLRELKNVVDDLKKQNVQQRFEISQLRKA